MCDEHITKYLAKRIGYTFISNTIKKAKNLKQIGLCECPIRVIEDFLYSLPQRLF